MSTPTLLHQYMTATLLDRLDGDDSRFGKIGQAATDVAKHLRENPRDLIPAILAGTDPDVPVDDPSIERAYQALIAAWSTLNSVHPSRPMVILRAILLAACQQAVDGARAAIPWLTAVDMIPFRRLGREESILRDLLTSWATLAETSAVLPGQIDIPALQPLVDENAQKPRKVDSNKLHLALSGAVAPSDKNNTALPGSNPHAPNAGLPWSYEYSPRMATLLVSELDALAKDQSAETDRKVSATIKSIDARWQAIESARTDRVQIQTLAWSQALYSSSARSSYRSMAIPTAVLVMVGDLLDIVEAHPRLAPASIGYLLSETVARLDTSASWNKKYPLAKILGQLVGVTLPSGFHGTALRSPAISAGRLNLRDLTAALIAGSPASSDLIGRTGIPKETELSLPTWAHAVFRQAQAVQLVNRLSRA